ncbi:MAG: hypothetical protein D6E12_13965 [Desulfovibrio sp.]|nr:MAG: hypothetical protein D6E12_13965 [Desulfovibrio sp.]
MKRNLVCLVVLGMMLLPLGAFAQDLVGEWVITGTSWGATAGDTDHGVGTGDRFVSAASGWTLFIEQVEEGAFHGRWCGPNICEDLVGVVRRDGSLLMADEDSTFFGTMYGEDLELCVIEPGESLRIAACRMMQRN